MSITFTINQNEGYFLARWSGKVSAKEVLDAYRGFFEGSEWFSGLNELTDYSEADMSEVSSQTMKDLTYYVQHFYEMQEITSVKAAAYAPHDLPYGLLRVYSALSDESPEQVCVFRELNEAKSWLNKSE